MAKMVIYEKATGKPHEYEGVDAREILANSPDVYTADPPSVEAAKDPDGDGFEGAPQNVANVENEFRREPVGANPPEPERDVAVIRNPVTDTPKMAETAEEADDASDDDVDNMTVAEMRAYASKKGISLGGATAKEDIAKAIRSAK